jgi:hypothetical protein
VLKTDPKTFWESHEERIERCEFLSTLPFPAKLDVEDVKKRLPRMEGAVLEALKIV